MVGRAGRVGGVSRIRILRRPEPLLERLAEAVKRRPERKLRAILACTFTFNSDWFETLLDHVFAETPRAGVPVDVVCDELQYRGHGRGYNVRRWPRERGLFHPKLLVVLFEDDVIWAEGSLNMTREGWQRNRELATLHEPGHAALPEAVRRLLTQVKRVAPAPRGGDAAGEILERTRLEVASDSLTGL